MPARGEPHGDPGREVRAVVKSEKGGWMGRPLLSISARGGRMSCSSRSVWG
jgi:hypothetical protein